MRMTESAAGDIPAAIIALLRRRAPDASICPSDVARHLAPEAGAWRARMPDVRVVAATLAREGRLAITRGDSTLDPDALGKGPIRLRRGPRFPPT